MEEPRAEDEEIPEGAIRALVDLMSRPRAWMPLGRREKGGHVIDLVGAPYHRLPAHRLMLLLVLQLAVRDRATEVRLEPDHFPNLGDAIGFRFSYAVDGGLYELVPPLPDLMPHIAREIESLAGLDDVRHRTARLLRRLASKLDGQEPGPQRGGFALRVGDSTVHVEVLTYPAELDQRYSLKLSPISAAASERAQAGMRRIFEERRSA